MVATQELQPALSNNNNLLDIVIAEAEAVEAVVGAVVGTRVKDMVMVEVVVGIVAQAEGAAAAQARISGYFTQKSEHNPCTSCESTHCECHHGMYRQ